MKQCLTSLLLSALITVAEAAEYPAVLDWSRRAVLSTPVSGVVDTVHVETNSRVQTGQSLLQLDQRPFETAVADARARQHKQETLLDEARRELERTRELYQRRVISEHDLQLGEIAYAVAQADHSSAITALSGARLQHEYSTLHAPFDGLVLAVTVSRGMTVINTQLATPLVTLARDRPMHALARIDADALDAYKPGQAVSVTVNATRYDGSLLHIGAEPDNNGHYTLAVEFDPGSHMLRAGLPAVIGIGN